MPTSKTTTKEVSPTQLFLTDKQVAARYGVKRDAVWRWVREGTFPAPLKFSPKCTRWRLADCEARENELSGRG